MREFDSLPSGSDETGTDWLDKADLLGKGIDPEIVDRLPRRQTGIGDQPVWHRDELPDLLRLAAYEAEREANER